MKLSKNLLWLPVLVLSACQTVYMPTAREVKKRPSTGGVIALAIDHRAEDRAKADSLMQKNCANSNFKIVDEGEIVVGQKTSSSSMTEDRDDSRHEAGTLFGIPVVAGTAGGSDIRQNATTTQLKEWQITYECETPKKTKK